MCESENKAMTTEEELVDILLDFIIAAANLAKKTDQSMQQRQIKKGGTVNGQDQRTGNGDQRSS